MRADALEAAWDALERGAAEVALELLGALASEATDADAGDAALCGALAHLDLGCAAEAGPWLDHATRVLGEGEPAVLAARADWHLARWEGAEALLLLERLEDDPATLERRGLAEFLAGRQAAAADLWARADVLDAEGAPPRLDGAGFDGVLHAAIAALPAAFQELLESVPIVVDPAPTAALFGGRAAAAASGIGPDLLGLFAGPSLLERNSSEGIDEPARLYLFQRNLEAAARTVDELEREIGITLYHELGHALGFDEQGVDELGLA